MYKLSATKIKSNSQSVIRIPHQLIETSPYQARQTYVDIDLLAKSILKDGQLQAIKAWLEVSEDGLITDGNKRYKAVAHDGHRRLRAFDWIQENYPDHDLIKSGILVIIIDRPSTTVDAIISQYIYNNTGSPFNAFEELSIVQQLISYGLTQTEIADRLGKSQFWVSNTLSLSKLPEEIKDLIINNRLSATLACSLYKESTDHKRTTDQILAVAKNEEKITKSKLTGTDGRKRRSKKLQKEILDANTEDELIALSKKMSDSELLYQLVSTAINTTTINDHLYKTQVSRVLWEEAEHRCYSNNSI